MGVRVIVHENVRALRSASTQHSNRYLNRKPKYDDFKNTLGICHRHHWDSDSVYAIVRVAPPNIGIGVVSHELAHAAVWLWEIENKFDEKIPLMCHNDEWFCWVLGELVRCTVNKFIEKGLYNNEDDEDSDT